MINSAYFVGRGEILTWINSTLHLSLSKVEEAAPGAVQCQLMDAVLQDVFNKLKITKPPPAAPKPQTTHTSRKIDGNATKAASTVPDLVTELKLCVKSLMKERDFYYAKLRNIGIMCENPDLEHVPIGAIHRILYSTDDSPSMLAEAEALVTELKLCMESFMKERDFYYAKLRNIEIMCENPDLEHVPIGAIHRILYSTDDSPSMLAEAEALLCVESLMKERDFYYAILRNIEIMCENPDLEHVPIGAIHRILYSTDDSPSMLAEAEAMLQEPIASGTSGERKRKEILTLEVDMAANLISTPRPKLSDSVDVHQSGSPLTKC